MCFLFFPPVLKVFVNCLCFSACFLCFSRTKRKFNGRWIVFFIVFVFEMCVKRRKEKGKECSILEKRKADDCSWGVKQEGWIDCRSNFFQCSCMIGQQSPDNDVTKGNEEGSRKVYKEIDCRERTIVSTQRNRFTQFQDYFWSNCLRLEREKMSLRDFYTNQCVMLLVDIDENCEAGDLAKVVEITEDEIYIQYSTERGMTSKPIKVTTDSIEPFRYFFWFFFSFHLSIRTMCYIHSLFIFFYIFWFIFLWREFIWKEKEKKKRKRKMFLWWSIIIDKHVYHDG